MQVANLTHRSVEKCASVAREMLSKKADFGANQNPAFEKAFGSIAFTYLQEKVPGLIQHVVGFQLLDRDEDGRKAIGVFVAQIGERIIDIPMFFINGELKGHQLMRLRQPDMFIPLREAFLDYLLSKLPQDLGEVGPGINAPSPMRTTPQMSPFNGSRLMKMSGDLDFIHDWAADLDLPGQFAAMRLDKQSLELGVSLLNRSGGKLVDLVDLMSGSSELLKTAARLADQYPVFGQRMNQRYGDDWLKTAATRFVTKQAKAQQLRAPLPAPRLKLAAAGIDSGKPELEFYRHPDSYNHQIKLSRETSEEQLAEIQRYGERIVDNRDLEKLAVTVKVERDEFRIEPPMESGVYAVFLPDGSGKNLVVIPAKERMPYNRRDLVIDKSGKKIAMPGRTSYVVRQTNGDETGPSFNLVETLGAKNTKPKEGDIFLLINNRKQVIGPFRCASKVSRGVMKIEDLSDSYHFTHGSDAGEFNHGPNIMVNPRELSTLTFDEGLDSGAVRIVKSDVIAGRNTMVKVLGNVKPDSPDDDWVSSRKYEPFALKLMDHDVVSFDNLSKFSNLQVRPKHQAVELNGVEMKLGQARRFLVQDCGIAVKVANEILESKDLVSRYIVSRPGEKLSLDGLKKYAFPVPNTPQFPAEEQPYASESGRYVIEEPTYGEDSSDPMPRREPLQPWEDPHDQMFQDQTGGGGMVEETGTSPDELFDVMGLVSLVRNSRIDSDVRKATRSLLQTIDRLGRMLFMFYTHSEEFESRYGDNDMQDLESALISVFEGAGDLFITLNRRSNDPSPEMDMMDLPLDM